MEETIGVLAKIAADGLVEDITSTAHRQLEEGWREIDRGLGDRYRHAQGNYLPDGLRTDEGIPRWMTAPACLHPEREAFARYLFDDEEWGVYMRTNSEMQTDRVPTVEDAVGDRLAAVEQQIDMILEGAVSDE